MKVCIFTDEGESPLGGIAPDGLVGAFTETDVAYVLGVRIFLLKRLYEPVRKILIEEEFHWEGSETSFRSRSAANARQARMSSDARSGKSVRISASLMPEARYSKTSYTVMRKPRMQGLPPRFAGSMVMRSCNDMMGRLTQQD